VGFDAQVIIKMLVALSILGEIEWLAALRGFRRFWSGLMM